MSEATALTDKQRRIYEFICSEIETRGYPPSIRDIGQAFEIVSPNGVMCHLKALEKKGYIKREGKHARAIQIDGVRSGGATLPMCGLVAAGVGLELVSQDDRLDLGELLGGKEHFALRVKGKSMIEDHIDDGDIVIVRKQATADSGDRVVALLDRDVTLKRFVRNKNQIRLEPANGTMEPIIVEEGGDISILGILVGVVRKC